MLNCIRKFRKIVFDQMDEKLEGAEERCHKSW